MQVILACIFGLIVILSTLTTIPLVVSALLCFTVISKSSKVFIIALFLGLLSDLFFLRIFGITSIFLVFFTGLVLLYQRRFEIQTIPFVFISSFLGSFFYLWFFGYDKILVQSLISSLLAVLFFRVMLNSFQHLDSLRLDPETSSG